MKYAVSFSQRQEKILAVVIEELSDLHDLAKQHTYIKRSSALNK
jgi:hypothetical protein